MRMKMHASLRLALGALLAAAAVTACGGAGGSASSASATPATLAPTTSVATTTSLAPTTSVATTSPATTTAPTTAAPKPTAAPTTTAAPAGSAASVDFASAKQQWVAGASASSAAQNGYWSQAATDLHAAIAAGAPSGSYTTAINELQQLESIPEMGATNAQVAEAQNDTAALNTFFGTPGLYD